MQKTFLAIIFLILLACCAPSRSGIVLAQPDSRILEECCLISSTIKWTSGKLNEVDCTKASPCTIVKGATLGPKTTTSCSLKANKTEAELGHNEWAMICFISTLNRVMNWIFTLMLVLAVLMIAIAGLLYLSSAGDSKRTLKAKQMIFFAIIGLAIALIAKFIPPVVKFFLGVS